ncbi:hypothetical protein D3C72_1593970 [compost metagenome]
MADVIEQPAREHVVQLRQHLFAVLEARAELGDAAHEDLVHLPVRAGEGVARVLDHGLLEREVRGGVVDGLFDDPAHDFAVVRAAGVVQRVDVLHDALVLRVDLMDPRIELGLPYKVGHGLQNFAGGCKSPVSAAESGARLI